jgi:hypothetical protein
MPDSPKLTMVMSYNYESFVGWSIRSVVDQGRTPLSYDSIKPNSVPIASENI